MTIRPRKTFDIDMIRVVIDTREQRPLRLAPLQVEEGTLQTGDYSVLGLEDEISLERKSLDDFLACCGRERERFERELMRMLAYPVRGVFIEATMADISMGEWRSKISPKAVKASIHSWRAQGIPIYLCGDHRGVADAVRYQLYYAARARFAKLVRFAGEQGYVLASKIKEEESA